MPYGLNDPIRETFAKPSVVDFGVNTNYRGQRSMTPQTDYLRQEEAKDLMIQKLMADIGGVQATAGLQQAQGGDILATQPFRTAAMGATTAGNLQTQRLKEAMFPGMQTLQGQQIESGAMANRQRQMLQPHLVDRYLGETSKIWNEAQKEGALAQKLEGMDPAVQRALLENINDIFLKSQEGQEGPGGGIVPGTANQPMTDEQLQQMMMLVHYMRQQASNQ
jgi:hypothetical protein